MINIKMKSIGLDERLIQESNKYSNLYIGRVSSQHKELYKVITEKNEITAEISGKLRFDTSFMAGYPAVGDFVMVDRTDNTSGNGIIHHILTRKSCFTRKMAGNTKDMQIVASNIDTIFICMSLNNDYNLRRLERYLSIAWESGAMPVVVLTKSDLCDDIQLRLDEVTSMAIGVDVVVTTSISIEGYLVLKDYITNGKTVAFIGSSGVGKTTLINMLIGRDLFNTKEIRRDDKGRHTTTRRELIPLPGGGAVIDTPGMRELGIISADFSKTFADIEELASKCRFRDCSHKSEPGCAVQNAINEGIVSSERLENYQKLKKESKYAVLNSKQIEKEKINEMFSGMGGIKNARKFIKAQKRRKTR